MGHLQISGLSRGNGGAPAHNPPDPRKSIYLSGGGLCLDMPHFLMSLHSPSLLMLGVITSSVVFFFSMQPLSGLPVNIPVEDIHRKYPFQHCWQQSDVHLLTHKATILIA